MKTITLKNRFNNDQVMCENIRAVEIIDGVEYLVVHKRDSARMFLMRKDSLEKVSATVDKTATSHYNKT